jgi:Secretion system C-terminal sorting domain
MNKLFPALFFSQAATVPLSAQQNESQQSGVTSPLTVTVPAVSVVPVSSCYGAVLLQTRNRVPVDTSLRIAGNGASEEMRKRVPVDTAQRVGTFNTEIAVFPNPASGMLYLHQLPEQTAVRLYSSSGQLIRDERATGNSIEIDLSALPEGVYVLQFPELNKVVRIVHTF